MTSDDCIETIERRQRGEGVVVTEGDKPSAGRCYPGGRGRIVLCDKQNDNRPIKNGAA